MRNKKIVMAITAAMMLVSVVGFAGTKDILIYVTRLGGDSASAQPYVDRFLHFLEGEIGWTASSMKGVFLVSKKEALDFISASKPGIGIMEPPLYFELRKKMQLKPIMQVESKDLVSEKLHVVVKDPAIRDLAGLKGKRVWTTLADYPVYLSRIVFGGQLDAGSQFELKQVGQALRGLRGVLRGDCDATILDDDQLAKAREIEGGKDLKTVYSSPALPPIPVVVVGSTLSEEDKNALMKTLKGMCASEKGGAICKEMHIGRFVPVNQALFSDAQKKYSE
jgi:ABC-type phosphate/phosphonate transport system substrate-binding protein